MVGLEILDGTDACRQFFLAPQNISSLFNTIDQVHAYNTRSSSTVDYEIKFSRLHKQGKSFSRLGVKI